MPKLEVISGKRGTGKSARALAECLAVADGGGTAVFVAPTHARLRSTAMIGLQTNATEVVRGGGRVLLTTVPSVASRVCGLRVDLMALDGVSHSDVSESLASLCPDGRLIEVVDA